MRADLRALNLAQGLALGLLVAASLCAPALLPWELFVLFMVGGFQLRLSDRRGRMRRGTGEWFSHIRMAPQRMTYWVAAAGTALIGGQGMMAVHAGLAALLCEALLYPAAMMTISSLRRSVAAMILLALMTLSAQLPDATGVLSLALSFQIGVLGCLFWLRGPDGDLWALAAYMTALGISVMAVFTDLLGPTWLAPIATLSALLTLAHASTLRRRLVPWRPGGDWSRSFMRAGPAPLPKR